jgi:SM-20-related protein
MWLNQQQITAPAIRTYRKALLHSTPHYVVIDQLFDPIKLLEVSRVLQLEQGWQTQHHTYSALYVDQAKWQKTPQAQRFVQRDVWQRALPDANKSNAMANSAQEFLQFLRGAEFMALLSRIFKVQITDLNVAKPEVNTNYFRLGASDFVNQHADDSPGREVCMLLYLNEDWQSDQGGELVFSGKDDNPVHIAPFFNRCVLFDPSSAGSEHWVKALSAATNTKTNTRHYRYNVTSWYWSE